MVLEIITDALLDTAKMLPFLFAAYFLIEYVERRHSGKIEKALAGGGKLGFITGAGLGLFPQCGFSAMAASLYSGRAITLGSLVAVFISTSDEAVPILISMPNMAGKLGLLLGAKLVVAIVAGFCLDFAFKKYLPVSLLGGYSGKSEDVDCHEHIESDSLIISTIKHTFSIAAFVLIFNLVLGFFVSIVGEAAFAGFVSGSGFWQPVIASFIGLVPNCASSILLTQLYAAGSLSFGGVLAGLCTGAGAGIAVLLRANKSFKQNLFIIVLLYLIGTGAGLIAQLIFH